MSDSDKWIKTAYLSFSQFVSENAVHRGWFEVSPRLKTDTEKASHPNEDFYEDLQTQEAIMAEVSGFYSDLYKERQTNPYYDKIIEALGPGAINLLTEAE